MDQALFPPLSRAAGSRRQGSVADETDDIEEQARLAEI